MTEEDEKPQEIEVELEEEHSAKHPDDMSSTEKKRYEDFNDLIECILNLDPNVYAQPWTDDMLSSMRMLLTKSVNSFPKKSRWIIELFRKFLFDNGQLIAMAATAHACAAQRREKAGSRILTPTMSDVKKSELSRE
jgi:hypothetical protein